MCLVTTSYKFIETPADSFTDEDERIRKSLLRACDDWDKGQFGSFSKEDTARIRNWLEKQKYASKAIEAVERIDKYIDCEVVNAHDMKDSNPDKKYCCGWDDALGEMSRILQDVYSNEKQKPFISAEESLGISQEEYNKIVDECIFGEQKEQKSREDIINETVKDKAFTIKLLKSAGILDETGELAEMYRSGQDSTECIPDSVKFDEGFKTGREVGFREGVESSKFAEWSDEDEKMVRFYEADYNNQIGDMSIKDVIDMRLKFKNWLVNRLKSLRTQPHWKPSGEQMKAMEEVRTIFHHHHLWDEINPSLYDYEELMRDLYKLM